MQLNSTRIGSKRGDSERKVLWALRQQTILTFNLGKARAKPQLSTAKGWKSELGLYGLKMH